MTKIMMLILYYQSNMKNDKSAKQNVSFPTFRKYIHL